MKYWINTKGNDKLIAIDEEVIYSRNPSKGKLLEFEYELKKGIIPQKMTGTPINYIKKIIANDSSNIIKIYHGEKNETEIDARKHKLEIINYLKENDKRKPTYSEYPEKWYRAITKPLIALAIIIFVMYSLYDIAYYLELGYEYEVEVRGIPIGGLMLLAAEFLGTLRVIVLGAILSLIPLWFAWRNYRLKRVIYELDFLKRA